jgi:hypothetical protein
MQTTIETTSAVARHLHSYAEKQHSASPPTVLAEMEPDGRSSSSCDNSPHAPPARSSSSSSSNSSSRSCSSEQPTAMDTSSINATAGLFIHSATDKPLPLSIHRTVPIPRFWKSKQGRRRSMGGMSSSGDVLRRTGSTAATFSQEKDDAETTCIGQQQQPEQVRDIPDQRQSSQTLSCSTSSGIRSGPLRSATRSFDRGDMDALRESALVPERAKAAPSAASCNADDDDVVLSTDSCSSGLFSFLKRGTGECVVQSP